MKHGGPVASVAVRNDGKRSLQPELNNVANFGIAMTGKEASN